MRKYRNSTPFRSFKPTTEAKPSQAKPCRRLCVSPWRCLWWHQMHRWALVQAAGKPQRLVRLGSVSATLCSCPPPSTSAAGWCGVRNAAEVWAMRSKLARLNRSASADAAVDLWINACHVQNRRASTRLDSTPQRKRSVIRGKGRQSIIPPALLSRMFGVLFDSSTPGLVSPWQPGQS